MFHESLLLLEDTLKPLNNGAINETQRYGVFCVATHLRCNEI